MTLGMNLGGITYYSPECPFIDRMRMAGDPLAKTGNASLPVGAFAADTALPSAAGAVPRVAMLDPGTHDYVILCDPTVAKVSVSGVPKAIVPADGRATFTLTRPDLGASVQVTVVSTGPVAKFVLMRADHEAAYLKGEVFNPDFIARVAPFAILRTLDWNVTNQDSFPDRRPLLTNAYFTSARGGMPAELVGQFAAKVGRPIWYPIHHLMTDAQMLDTFHALDRTAGSQKIRLEWSNEFGWTYHAKWAAQQASARYGMAKPQPTDIRRYSAYRSGLMAKLAASVSDRFTVELCSQATSNNAATMAAMLAGWDESGAPRSLIAGYSNAGYLNFNYPKTELPALLALWKANDADGFYKSVTAKIPVLAARHKAAADCWRTQGIAFDVYETDISITTSAPSMTDAAERAAFLAWLDPLVHSDRMADLIAQNAQAAFDAGARDVLHYQLTGTLTQFGVWGALPHIAGTPYPLYDRLVKMARPDPFSALAARVADMQRQLAALAGDIAAAAVG